MCGGTERQEIGAGRNHLDGGSGDDRLYGGYEEDILVGGIGKDRFTYLEISDSNIAHSDRVTDFEQGAVKLIFRGKFRAGGTLPFIGEEAFSHSPGKVRSEASVDFSVVMLDADGDGMTDLQIAFIGQILFQQSDLAF